jgi:protein-tyrosine-phosphatase
VETRSRLRSNSEVKSKTDEFPMSSKQLFNSVKNGQKITFTPFDTDEVVGYLAGLDEDHFFVLEPQHDGFKKKILRRATCPVYEIHDPYTFATEQFRAEMDEVIHKFRTWVLRNMFGQKSRAEAENHYERAAR